MIFPLFFILYFLSLRAECNVAILKGIVPSFVLKQKKHPIAIGTSLSRTPFPEMLRLHFVTLSMTGAP
jgi:hypothetical protein